MKSIDFIQKNTQLKEAQIKSVLSLTEIGGTIPFIARYRKEQTGNLDEVQIDAILKSNTTFENIVKRKEHILKVMDESGDLTAELDKKIKACFELTKLEDIYLPFKKKKVNLATKATKAGLIGLAKMVMSQQNGDPLQWADRFLATDFDTAELAMAGAEAIIVSWIVENDIVRDKMRDSFLKFSILSSKKIKNAIDKEEKFKAYYEFTQAVNQCPSYRLLAALRGENEKVLRVKIRPNDDYNLQWLNRFFIKQNNQSTAVIEKAIKTAYKKNLEPSLETEVRNHFKGLADDKSIGNFSKNLRQILLAPPIGSKRILAIDPGFRTGCKVVCLAENGDLLNNTTVYPHPPKNERSKASAKIGQLVEMYKIDAIAIGDGTAGRESENWIKHIHFNRDVKVYIVREDGASIYSASKIAREEFPDFDVTVRGAVSIGRRLSDPLAELVKIDPKSLGVGQYQHDVNQVKLKEALDFMIFQAVNQVGVNLNTASKHLLAYVSGLGPKLAESIVEYRSKNGSFKTREELKKVPRLGAKAFEQAAGFLRIKNALNPLDNSAIHPEQYSVVSQLSKTYKVKPAALIGNDTILSKVLADEALINEIGGFTLADIVKELKKPGVDPRASVKIFEFTPGIKTIEDVKVGMMINGIVTNVTDFGAFVNVGIKQNGLIHKTQLANHFVETPTDVIQIDAHVQAKVIEVDAARNRIGLTLKI
ncbi:RNA-binding transcriptional accessory protein [Putridiphycobacter roseus]|uniref:RNA-binding transcriptional accessory protein n=1 Tax=Putridiphycobacter roseus TaxID=2219161 RepID=A0A2W1NH56_9FLAO|nr:Tex family protein [Putridiphycobacter roseus]PZE18433.1 RNA-binding transcriptional accessory protein [Putridiphycobacter roseus]